jgi:hypothetical protein
MTYFHSRDNMHSQTSVVWGYFAGRERDGEASRLEGYQTDRQTAKSSRQTHRQTGRLVDRQTGRLTSRQTKCHLYHLDYFTRSDLVKLFFHKIYIFVK